jgi:WD40 repeat protein
MRISILSLLMPFSDLYFEDIFYGEFHTYRNWASSCLTRYKNDVLKFIGPIFTYMYLYFLEKDKLEQARLFFCDFSDCLSNYEQKKLSTIQTKNDLSSDFVRKSYFYKTENSYVKYVVSICKSSLLLLMAFIEEKKLSSILYMMNNHVDINLSTEVSNDYPIMIPDIENYKNVNFLSLNVVIEEDKRREVKVPLPVLNQDYIQLRNSEIEQKMSLGASLPFIVCHNVKTHSLGTSSCTCIHISEDGSLILCGFEDSVIRAWNLTCPENFYTFIGHSGSILSVNISPEAALAISSSDDCSIRLWSILTSSCITIFYFHVVPVWCVKFSPTGHYFASGGLEGAVCVWSIEYTTPLRVLAGHISDVYCVQFHPRATFLASGSADKSLRLWDTSSGDCVRVFCSHKSPVTSISFSKSGKLLYSGDEDGSVKNWDINEKELLWDIKAQGMVTSISVSQENSLIACTLQNSSVVLITSSGKIEKICKTKLLKLYYCSFSLRNLLSVVGSYN